MTAPAEGAAPAGARAQLARADILLALARWLTAPRGADGRRVTGDEEPHASAAFTAAGWTDLAELARRVERGFRATADEALAEEYARLFEGARACPAEEASWVRRDKGAILADVAAFSEAFGIGHRAGTGERIDHLAAELELCALLLVAEVEARMKGADEQAAIAAGAVDRFASDHPGEWIASFAAALERVARLEPFADLGRLIGAVWNRFAAERGWSVAEADPDAVPVSNARATPYECGGCPQPPG